MSKLWLFPVLVICSSPLAILAHPSASLQKATKIRSGIDVYIHDDTIILKRVEYRLPPAIQVSRKVVIFHERLSVTQKGLILTVHNRHLSLNGKGCGKLRSGDRVVVGADGSIRINGIKR